MIVGERLNAEIIIYKKDRQCFTSVAALKQKLLFMDFHNEK